MLRVTVGPLPFEAARSLRLNSGPCVMDRFAGA